MDKTLLEKYFTGGECTESELLLIREYLNKAGKLPEDFFYSQWKSAKGVVDKGESNEMWMKIEEGIVDIKGQKESAGSPESIRPFESVRSLRSLRWHRPVAAAAVIGILLFSALFYRWHNFAGVQETVWKRVYNNSKDIKYVKLEDGTNVWLNAHSVLGCDELYAHNGRREIYLEGEAFFDVAQDPARPFTVHTRQLKTTVLGTTFNIRAWPSLPEIQIALVSGKVRVASSGRDPEIESGNHSETGVDSSSGAAGDSKTSLMNDSRDLTAGEVLIYNSAAHRLIVLEKAVREDMVGWVKGKIVLDNTPLPDILRQLAQIYNVSILFDADKLETIRLSGQFRRDNIADVLKNVLFPLNLTYSLEDGKYKIHKSNSNQ
jgi:transmembrane sensor